MLFRSRLLHIHNAKIIFGSFFSLLPKGQTLKFIEMGHALSGLYPFSLILFHALIFVFTCAVSIQLIFYVKKYLNISEFIVFGMGLFILLKNTIDGGLLSGETILIGMPIYIYFLMQTKIGTAPLKKSRIPYTGLYFGFAFGAVMHYILFSLLGKGTWSADLVISYAMGLFCVLLIAYFFSFAEALVMKRKKGILAKEFIFLLIMVLCVGTSYEISQRLQGTQGNRLHIRDDRLLPRHSELFVYIKSAEIMDELEARDLIRPTENVHIHNYRAVRGVLQKDITYYQLSKILQINANVEPIRIDGDNCSNNKAKLLLQLGYAHPRRLAIKNKYVFDVVHLDRETKIGNKDFGGMLIDVEVPSCLPFEHILFNNILAEAGIESFIGFKAKGIWKDEELSHF